MIACASRSRQCADARCALARRGKGSAQAAGKQASGQRRRKRDARTTAEVGGREDGRGGGEAMRCVAASGVAEGCRGKGADPLVLRSGLPPNRAATAYRPGGGWLSFSLFPFLVSVSLLLFLETAGIGVPLGLLAPIPLFLFLSRSTHEGIEGRYVKLVKNERIAPREAPYSWRMSMTVKFHGMRENNG